MSVRSRLLRAVGSGALFGLGAVLWALWLTAGPSKGAEYLPGTAIDVLMVPGGDAGPRVEEAARLYGLHRTRVLISGAGYGGDDARNLAVNARRLGVPSDAIELETEARTTEENMVNTWPILKKIGAARVVVVTGSGHAARAFCMAERAWPGVEVKVAVATGERWSIAARLREALKYLRYRLTGRC